MIYQTMTLTWKDIELTLAYNPDHYPAADIAHIEIRCDRSLPLTETGYRSIFIPKGDITDIKIAAALVLQEMDKAAEEKGWQPEVQLSLF